MLPNSALSGGDYFVVIDGKLRIAHEIRRDAKDGSITANLYRNLDDYRADRAMERGLKFWR